MLDDAKIVPLDEIPTELHCFDLSNKDEIATAKYLFQKMLVVCFKNGGVGLHACQIGEPFYAFIVKSKGTRFDFWEMYVNVKDFEVTNPDTVDSIEGCLSISNGKELYKVQRNKAVRFNGVRLFVSTLDKQATKSVEPMRYEVYSDYAIKCQHEIHHGMGILISDIGEKVESTKTR